MVHGEWPDGTLFLYNSNPKDRRISNIGLAPNPPADGVLTQAYVKKLFTYDPTTGNFFHAVTQPGGAAQFGQLAGTLGNHGYWTLKINSKRYQAHRIAWLYMTGEWPKDQIDHRNNDKSDNRFENLREASNTENQWNQRIDKSNKTGVKGVHSKHGKFIATCNNTYSRTFKTLEEAAEARIAMETELQGEFAWTPRTKAHKPLSDYLAKPVLSNAGAQCVYRQKSGTFRVTYKKTYVGNYKTVEAAITARDLYRHMTDNAKRLRPRPLASRFSQSAQAVQGVA